ncbi:hypothetical protein E4T44_04954 [Aureobasidium sp. EXF-8845]|nr:hypothetical protein E4T44_04954 [Aureobasidium sp. EXF-8845]KAI4851610.1 hypothetical protein E4T45_05017 [Aureobasidium sp. EXF-8846]
MIGVESYRLWQIKLVELEDDYGHDTATHDTIYNELQFAIWNPLEKPPKKQRHKLLRVKQYNGLSHANWDTCDIEQTSSLSSNIDFETHKAARGSLFGKDHHRYLKLPFPTLFLTYIIMNFLHLDPYGQQPCKFNAFAFQVSSPMPQDSGYASEPNDPFERAFRSQSSPQKPSYAQLGYPSSEETYTTAHTYPTLQKQSLRPRLRHQQSMPVLPYTYHQSNSHETLDERTLRLSIDAGINSMTGYCDIDSLLAAAYNNTCTTQTKRFQTFASQHTSLIRTPKPVMSLPLRSPQLISEPAYPELDNTPAFVEEAPRSPNKAARGRRRGRSTHTAVEQRYRHNLVSHFQKLASSVPHIQTFQLARAGQVPKPSKAEILLAASGYIQQLEKEVERLRLAAEGDLSLGRDAPKMVAYYDT